MPTWTGWPPRSKLSFYWKQQPIPLQRDNGRIDLSDTIMGNWTRSQRTVEMRLRTESPKCKYWDEEELKRLEENIRYDLGFDGYRVIIYRLAGEDQPCDTDMMWKLVVRRTDS